jgi:hypothetical protein
MEINELVRQVSTTEAKSGQEVLMKIEVLMRAGTNKECIEAIRELKAMYPRLPNNE